MSKRTFQMGHATCIEDGASMHTLMLFKIIEIERIEKSIPKLIDKKIELLAKELAKTDDNIIRNAIKLLQIKIKEIKVGNNDERRYRKKNQTGKRKR